MVKKLFVFIMVCLSFVGCKVESSSDYDDPIEYAIITQENPEKPEETKENPETSESTPEIPEIPTVTIEIPEETPENPEVPEIKIENPEVPEVTPETPEIKPETPEIPTEPTEPGEIESEHYHSIKNYKLGEIDYSENFRCTVCNSPRVYSCEIIVEYDCAENHTDKINGKYCKKCKDFYDINLDHLN